MLAKIFVTPKKSVLDPQGEAVRKAIHTLGMECVESARIGKYIELKISGSDVAKTKAKLEAICHDLLSNPVIEDFELHLDGAVPAPAKASPAPAPAKAEKKAEKAKKAEKKEAKSAKELKSTAKDKTSSKKKKKK